jgi:hypothetical protein
MLRLFDARDTPPTQTTQTTLEAALRIPVTVSYKLNAGVLFAPLLDAATRSGCIEANRYKACSVERVLLCAQPQPRQHVLAHYLRLVAEVIETDLRNRLQTAQAGSVCNEMRVPIEIDAEVLRRADEHCELVNGLRDRHKKSLPEPTQRERDVVDDNYRTLMMFQLLSVLLSDRLSGNEEGVTVTDDNEAALALFFSTMAISRSLQAVLCSERSLARLPDHRPIRRSDMAMFMRVLQTHTERYRARALLINEYVDLLRQYVFWGIHSPVSDEIHRETNANTNE